MDGLFDMTRDLKAYKTLLRDFLIEVLEFGGEEDVSGGLYAEERADAAAEAAQMDAARRAAVPGLLNPYQAAADDDDL